MNILVVDDQKYVIDGLKKGIDFQKLGLKEAYFAYSAFEAKKIIRKHSIDILLCDIEMPYENGLQLLEWIRKHEYGMECIFLTAHADFDYARSAMTLGSFEYILQPARYQDIEECLLRVIQKIVRAQEKERYYSYGRHLFTERDRLTLMSVQSWFRDVGDDAGGGLLPYIDWEEELSGQEAVFLAVISVCDKKKAELWEEDLLLFCYKNILEEIGVRYGMACKIYRLGMWSCLLFLYRRESFEESLGLEVLGEFKDVAGRFLGLDFAVYCAYVTSFLDMGGQVEYIHGLQEKYPGDQPGIYKKGSGEDTLRHEIFLPERAKWENLLLQGYGAYVAQEAEKLMEDARQKNQLTTEFLKQLYSHYMMVLNAVMEKRNLGYRDVFGDENYLEAYTSREGMENLIYKSSDFFNQSGEFSEDDRQQVEKIKEYIFRHLEQDIRRDDIAAAVFLNPNYVSRLFKKETNRTLKDFITEEKLKLAQTLIRTTNLSISLVAVKVGYTNFSHFSQLYKKYFNISPSEERKEKKE